MGYRTLDHADGVPHPGSTLVVPKTLYVGPWVHRTNLLVYTVMTYTGLGCQTGLCAAQSGRYYAVGEAVRTG